MHEQSQPYQPDSHLGVRIGGDWTVHDFMLFFAAIERIYAASDLTGRASRGPRLGISAIRRRIQNAPYVASVSYSSPGLINFEGLGEPLEAIRRILKDIRGGHFLEMKAQAIDIDIKKEELRHLRKMNKIEELSAGLHVANEASALLRANGYSEEEINSLIRRGFLEPAVDLLHLFEQQKLTGVDESQVLPPPG